jgi:hypothetical protein
MVEDAQTGVSLTAIRSMIFEDEDLAFNTYLAYMLDMFRASKVPPDEDAVLEAAQDAWNQFPHRSLHGRSPAELIFEELPP